MKVLAGIVLYYPDKNRLQDNIDRIFPQVDALAVFDNGGGKDALPQDERIIYLTLDRVNVGIARALNELSRYGQENGYDWILTLDQDSVCPEGMIETYKRFWDDLKIGILCPIGVDRNYGQMEGLSPMNAVTHEIDACITSGSLMRLSAWKEVGGFWNELFIDMVDFDICWAMKVKGYKIIQAGVFLDHEVGHGKPCTLFGKRTMVFNHPPFRVYYMIRNTIAVCRRHGRVRQGVRWIVKRSLLINLYEDRRLKKVWMILKGIVSGLMFKVKPL